MEKNKNKQNINRPQGRNVAPRRHARIDLGNTRKESMGEWLFNHRVGLLAVFAVFVLAGTVLATARYSVERVDLEYFIEIVPQELEEEKVAETKPTVSAEELYQRMQQVRNVVSNEAAQEEDSSGSSEQEQEVENPTDNPNEGVDGTNSSSDDGMSSVRGTGKGGKGGGNDKGDNEDENKSTKPKYQGACTVSYRFEEPVRNHANLYIPAYTARGGGVVVLDVWLDRNGTVTSARVASSTNSSLNQIALQAARNYNTQFNIDGSAPQSHKGTITYTFIAQ
ncbi:MAG: energy transducer TonB [Alistipes sp.]|nr:energy transducer TonB [Alistipes sp.]